MKCSICNDDLKSMGRHSVRQECGKCYLKRKKELRDKIEKLKKRRYDI
jgi:ribosomal protein S27AE